MKILIFSDSHGLIQRMEKAVHQSQPVDAIIHLGDCLRDALKLREQYPEVRFELVTGNNDWSAEYPSEKLIEIEGKRFFMTHGHHYGVKSGYQRIIMQGKAVNADMVLFGHTHIAEEVFHDGMLVVNPGSISLPKHGQRPSYSVLEIKEGKLLSRFIRLK